MQAVDNIQKRRATLKRGTGQRGPISSRFPFMILSSVHPRPIALPHDHAHSHALVRLRPHFFFFFSFQRFPSCSLHVEYSNDPISNFYRQPRGETFDFATMPRQNGKHEQRYTDTVNFSVSRLLENFVVCFASASRIDKKTIRKDQPLPPVANKVFHDCKIHYADDDDSANCISKTKISFPTCTRGKSIVYRGKYVHSQTNIENGK